MNSVAMPVARRAGKLARISQRLREHGVGPTLRKAFADFIFRASTSVILEYRPGDHRVGANAEIPAWLSFMVLRDGNTVPPLCEWMAHRRDAFGAMLANGKIGIFALYEGVAVGCAWIALSDHHDAESREFYRVPPGEAYHYCWMIDPSVRRRNIGLPLCRYVMKTLGDMGIQRQFGVVDRVNRASYKIQSHFGYTECGVKVMHYCILGTRWTRMGRYQGVLGTTTPGKAERARLAQTA